MVVSPFPGPLNHQQDWIDVFDNLLDTTNVYATPENVTLSSSSNNNVTEKAGVPSSDSTSRELQSPTIDIPISSKYTAEVCTSSTVNQVQTLHMTETPQEDTLQPNDESIDSSPDNNSGSDDKDDVKAKFRSEKKRSRERQRRSDVNTQFADLTTLLRRVECEATEGKREAKYIIPTNRIDLIARTVSALERTYEENNKRRIVIEKLTKQVEESKNREKEAQTRVVERDETKKQGMMMMVPMMMQQPNASASIPTPSMPMSHQSSYMPYCHMPPSMYPPHSTASTPHAPHQYFQPMVHQNNYYPYATKTPVPEDKTQWKGTNKLLNTPPHDSPQPVVNHQLQNMVGNLAHCA